MNFDIKYFARLARIKLSEDEEARFSRDLGEILDHVKQLQEIETEQVLPMTGGTELKNIFREDEPEKEKSRKGTDQFPVSKDDFLSVPKVFE